MYSCQGCTSHSIEIFRNKTKYYIGKMHVVTKYFIWVRKNMAGTLTFLLRLLAKIYTLYTTIPIHITIILMYFFGINFVSLALPVVYI